VIAMRLVRLLLCVGLAFAALPAHAAPLPKICATLGIDPTGSQPLKEVTLPPPTEEAIVPRRYMKP
jgi:hypothetical protein